jgi:hypothetical protein
MKKRRKKLRCCWGCSDPNAQCKAHAAIVVVKIDPPKGVRSRLPLCNEHYIAMAEDITIGMLASAMRTAVHDEAPEVLARLLKKEDEKETRH